VWVCVVFEQQQKGDLCWLAKKSIDRPTSHLIHLLSFPFLPPPLPSLPQVSRSTFGPFPSPPSSYFYSHLPPLILPSLPPSLPPSPPSGVHEFVWIISFISFLFLYPSTFNLLEIAAVEKPKLHMWATGIMRITRYVHPPSLLPSLHPSLSPSFWTLLLSKATATHVGHGHYAQHKVRPPSLPPSFPPPSTFVRRFCILILPLSLPPSLLRRHPQMVGQGLWCAAHTLWMGNSFVLVASAFLMAHHLFG